MSANGRRMWTDLTWADFQARDMGRTIAILPVAAVEQHGPHLPTGTDAMIMEGMLARVVGRLPADLDALVLPAMNVGLSPEHIDFPGTLSLSAPTFAAMVADIGASVARAGCRKLVIANAHGGNVAALDIASRELRRTHAMLAVVASWHRFGYPDGLYSAQELAHGIHGGDVETSLMLAFRPDLVRSDEVADFRPASIAMERDYQWLRAGRPVGFGWLAQDMSDSGAMGDASAARAQKGEASADYGATAFIELLRDVEAFDLSTLGPGPLD